MKKTFNIHSKYLDTLIVYLALFFIIAMIALPLLHLDINLLPIICLYVVIIICIQILRNKNLASSYSEGNSVDTWYDESLEKIGIDWCLPFIDQIMELISAPIIFVSPSANCGVYEKLMFTHITDTTEQDVKFICADMADIKYHEINTVHNNGTFIYLEKKNALDIETYLEGNTCNVIFDKKGALWYLKGAERMKLIQQYYSCLSCDGILVVDSTYVNHTYSSLTSLAHVLLSILPKNPIYRVEESTEQKLKSDKQFLLRFFSEEDEITFPKLKFKIYKKNPSIF